jgi:formate/nitrite transporter FocA (FNT family)
MEAFGVALLVGFFALNVAATVAALLSKRSSRQQRLLQVLLVWALPILGAVLVLYFTTVSEEAPRPEPEDLANRSEGPASSVSHLPPGGPYP